MIYNIFTFDYEIFGNGSGSVKYCLVEPTRAILDLLDIYSVKATFFIDVGLIWAAKENEKKGLMKHLDYSPSRLIEDQLLEIYRRGHDIQLHIHCQMIGSLYKNDQFMTNPDRWRITDFPYEKQKDPINSISGLVSQGKRTLEKIIQKQSADYKVIAFRAGGLCSRPEKDLIRVLKENWFRFDFSPACNYKMETGAGRVDFTNVFNSPDPVRIGESYRERDSNSSLVAVPVYGAKYYYFSEIHKRILGRISGKKNDNNWQKKRPVNCTGNTETPGYSKLPVENFLMRKIKTVTINFYLEANAKDMIWCTKNALRRSRRKNKDVYLVGLGHPKAMGDLSQLESYLNWINAHHERDRIEFKRAIDLLHYKFN